MQNYSKKRSKGLCYKCDEKFSPGHVCKKKEMSVLVTQHVDNEEAEDSDAEDMEPHSFI